MFPPRLAMLSLACLLAACQAERAPATSVPAPAPAPEADGVGAALPGTDASAIVVQPPDDPPGFDRKAIAGRYAGSLADGRPVVLEIEADGKARLDGQAGSWSVGEVPGRLLFDPDDKAGTDRWFAIGAMQALHLLDGRDASPDAAPVLRRD